MVKDYVMPKLAMAMNEGTVNEWLVGEGDYIKKGATIASIETEKVAYDLESPETGYIHIIVPVGETVPCGEVIGQFAETEGELAELQYQPARVPAAAAAETDGSLEVQEIAPAVAAGGAGGNRIIASPLARKMARDRNIDLSSVGGTGPRGRIVKRDIVSAERRGATRVPELAGATGFQELARVPFKGARKSIADRTMQSLQSTAQLSSFWESDVTDLLRMREKFVARADQFGTRVSVNAFLVKALVYGVRQVPIANSRLDGDDIVIYSNVNLGFAVSMPGQNAYDTSLLVPVLHDVENLGVVEIDRRLKDLVARVRDGQANQGDLGGSTITLSSTAGIAPPGHRSTPVLNFPNAVLFGPSTPCEKPAVVNGKIKPRTLMPLNVTFDHRLIDGDPAVRFMSAIHDALENPELLLS